MKEFTEKAGANLAEFLSSDNLAAATVVAVKIAIIIAAAAFLVKITDRAINRAMGLKKTSEDRTPRLVTLTGVINSFVKYAVYFMAALMILQELNVKTSSLVAGAGIVGLVVGLGAQNLIKDVVAGFFIILEDQYSVGDYIQVGQYSGFVEQVNLRSTQLKDWGGELHIIPNGQIATVTNDTRSDRMAQVDVWVPYEEDAERILAILKETAAEAAREMETLTKGPNVPGIVEFGERHYRIRVTAMTVPLQQWAVERELRFRIKRRFDKEGISLPRQCTLFSGREDGGEKTV